MVLATATMVGSALHGCGPHPRRRLARAPVPVLVLVLVRHPRYAGVVPVRVPHGPEFHGAALLHRGRHRPRVARGGRGGLADVSTGRARRYTTVAAFGWRDSCRFAQIWVDSAKLPKAPVAVQIMNMAQVGASGVRRVGARRWAPHTSNSNSNSRPPAAAKAAATVRPFTYRFGVADTARVCAGVAAGFSEAWARQQMRARAAYVVAVAVPGVAETAAAGTDADASSPRVTPPALPPLPPLDIEAWASSDPCAVVSAAVATAPKAARAPMARGWCSLVSRRGAAPTASAASPRLLRLHKRRIQLVRARAPAS